MRHKDKGLPPVWVKSQDGRSTLFIVIGRWKARQSQHSIDLVYLRKNTGCEVRSGCEGLAADCVVAGIGAAVCFGRRVEGAVR